MKTLRLLSAICILLLFSTSALAQDAAENNKVIDDLIKKAEDVKSYKVDINTLTHAMGEPITIKGTMSFEQPGKMRMSTVTDMMGGMKQDIYKTGDIIWTYMPIMKMTTKMDVSRLKQEMPGQQPDMDESDVATMLKDFPKDAITFVGKKKADGKDVYVLRVAPEKFNMDMTAPQKNFPVQPKKIEFLVYADNGLPHKILMYGKDDALIMEQTYSNYQLNIDIPDSEFEFTPPEGAQVMDMTEATINMMRQMKESEQAQPAPAE
ncbi:MAG: outer membrane lipoprotein carrier protein LolA [Candidatus Abyssobacteria bacterium SURF_5]|uniref:Outer membrane lipoprotein carrier protein LolA n=1 Tax=Abyssobacteria bacterium (strain SURF_5) TaxID=2093360 RepID=A0A3A4N0Q2_ABYX5|nr:MAG: outer membrane lipoprotein carrier protein LolA [Candidatus Abyssubacteria bacterium SURF_5]